MKENIVIVTVLVVISLLFAGAFWFLSSDKEEIAISPSSEAKVVVEESFHDWGEIGIKNGKVVADFKISNEGTETLKLLNIVTSCSCTTAQIISDGEGSPMFGMHTKSKFVKEIAPGESAVVQGVYDPMFHGPSGIGSITRQITIETNDAQNPKIVLGMSANVVR